MHFHVTTAAYQMLYLCLLNKGIKYYFNFLGKLYVL